MFGRTTAKNSANIGNNSNSNTVFQGNTFNNPTIVVGSEYSAIDIAGQCKRYDLVQNQVALVLEAAKRTHPLFPEFSATYDSRVNKLISTPETEDALRNHPKRIVGTTRLDYAKYPYMDRAETPWAYAYRTQTEVEMDTTSYQEFLGEMEDPFPVHTFSDGMKTIIKPPPFPDAVEATIVAGRIAIPFLLQRLPCMEFGLLKFGNVSHSHGFDFQVSTTEDTKHTTINITKTGADSLQVHLLREQLLKNIAETREIRIVIDGKDLLNAKFSQKDLPSSIFTVAAPLAAHLERLLTIEKYTGCSFNPNFEDISASDFRTAQMLAASLDGKWHRIRCKYEDDIRSDFDHIDETILQNEEGEHSRLRRLWSISNSMSSILRQKVALLCSKMPELVV